MAKPVNRCVVHIGMHETGAGALRQALASLHQVPGWTFARLGHHRNLSVPLHAMFATEPMRYHWFAKAGRQMEEVQLLGARWRLELRDLAERCGGGNLLISGEGASLLDPAGVDRLRDFLSALADDVVVVGLVRPPVGFVSAIFQRHLRHGQSRFSLAKVVPHYRKRFEKFDQSFGRDRVLLWQHDPDTATDDELLAGFSDRAGLPPLAAVAGDPVREGLSRMACAMLYAYRRFGPGYGTGPGVVAENNALIQALSRLDGPAFRLSGALAEQALASQDDDLRWMALRLGEPLTEERPGGPAGVASEADLLELPGGAAALFEHAFTTTHGVTLDDAALAEVDDSPQGLAVLMQACRDAFARQRAARASAATAPADEPPA